jgi:hypothetical protein
MSTDISDLPPLPPGAAQAVLSALHESSSDLIRTQVDPTSDKGPTNLSKNPSLTPEEQEMYARRRPMSTPTRKLEVPEIQGWHMHWFRDSNIPRALQAGYVFVDSSELTVNQFNVATSQSITGNSDLGTRVRVQESFTEAGQPGMLTLMKIRQEWYDEDQLKIASRNMEIMKAIFRDKRILGNPGMRQDDADVRYVKTALFSRKLPKDV